MPGIIVVDPQTDFLPLCTAQDAKDQLKIEETLTPMQTRALERYIDAASLWIENALNRRIKSRAYSGSVDGNGSMVMYPKDENGRPLCPITAVTSIVVDDVAFSASDGTTVGYLLYGNAGYIRLVGAAFTTGYQNIDLALTAGFTTIPPVLVDACCELVAAKWRSRDKQDDNIQSVSEMGTTVTFRLDMLKKETREGIMFYRKLAV